MPLSNPSAERRRKRAETKGELSISHSKGDLHTHHIEANEISPEEVVRTRGGSNCGKIALEPLVAFHAQRLRNEYVAVTDHSRDANIEKAIEGITVWFEGWHTWNEQQATSESGGSLTV